MNKITFLIAITSTLIMACNNTKSVKENHETSKNPEVVKIQNIDHELYFQAALDGNKAIIEQAIKEGLDVNTIDSENRTALMLASFNGHTEIAKLLIENKANVNQLDKLNRSALMFASTGPFNSTVRLLLESGAKVNLADNVENWTAVMFAAGEGQLDVVKTLVDAGADLTMLDVDGESAYDFAVSKGHTEVANYINTYLSK